MNVNDPNDPNESNVHGRDDRTIRTDPDGAVAHDARPLVAHATIFPATLNNTVTWFFDGVMDRAEQYDSIELAMARADEIRGILLRDGWKEA